MKVLAIGIFIITYVLLLALPKYRAYVALSAAALFVVLGILPVGEIFSTIDWNVLLMIGGTMGVVALFIESRMPSLLADLLIARTPNVKWAIVALSLFASLISAFVDNVATVLMVAPVALTISKKLNISPVPSVISIVVASNLQGAATLVGDTTSILLGGYAHMDFLDFFFFRGVPGLFWVVQIGALVSSIVLLILFRKLDQPIHAEDRTEVKDYFPTYLLIGMIGLLILASFIPNKPGITNGLIAVGLMVIGILREVFIKGNKEAFKSTLQEVDFFTILLLAGIFMLIGGLTHVGVIRDIATFFVSIGGDNLFLLYTLIVWVSVVASAFVDNIPYVATMLPVTQGIAQILGIEPYVLYFGLLVGSTLGGNLTPIGASANITALGILRKEGHEVSAGEFMRIGVPFTLSAVITGYILVWVLW